MPDSPLSSGAAAPGRPTRAYLDHAATTPVRPEVAAQIAEDLASGLGGWANPAAAHGAGRRAGALLAEARARIGAAVGADPHEVLLVSSATEADALAVVGRALAARRAGVEGPALIVSSIEHPAVLDSARTAERLHGARLVELPVGEDGLVSPADAGAAVAEAMAAGAPPALVSVMAANNETGAVQPTAEIVEAVRSASASGPSGAPRPGEPGWVPVHGDAVGAVGRIPFDVGALGLDAASIAGHKLGAPVGVGALVARRELALESPTGGGRQERGLRSGTQDVVGARALALALELAVAEREAEGARLEALRDRLLAGCRGIEGLRPTLGAAVPHLPGTAHLLIEDGEAEALLLALDAAGVDASAGSACHAGAPGPSHVLLAMGADDAQAASALRVSMGRTTTAADIDRLLDALPGAVALARRAARAWH